MTDLNTRVRTALGSDWESTRSSWEGLIHLYEADREAFYLLACGGQDVSLDETVTPLADLAQRVRAAVRSTYRVTAPSAATGAVIFTAAGDSLTVPAGLLPAVREFLLKIDGKGVSDRKGRDYEGELVSEAQVRFMLGDEEDRKQVELRAAARREARPLVFRLSPEDAESLGTLPAYVRYGLLRCAKNTVLAPTAVYRGLKRGEKAPQRLREGWAICGKPIRCYDNTGRPCQAPADMVYMVYADSERYVFDWDWVQEDPHEPGHPLDTALRFGDLVDEQRELVLELPEPIDDRMFDPTRPALSRKGDCVFCYLTDSPSYAARINEDLTVFYALENGEQITGFKIKNLQRILREQQRLNLTDAPGLNVLILSILRKTLRDHHDMTIRLYEIIITALVDVKILLPSSEDCEPAATN